jgi:hypothetical protein
MLWSNKVSSEQYGGGTPDAICDAATEGERVDEYSLSAAQEAEVQAIPEFTPILRDDRLYSSTTRGEADRKGLRVQYLAGGPLHS